MRRWMVAGVAIGWLFGCSDVVEEPDPWGFDEPQVEESDEPVASPDPHAIDPEPEPDPMDPEPEPENPDECVDAQLELFSVNSGGADRFVTVVEDRVFVSGYLQGQADTDVLEWTGRELLPLDESSRVNDVPVDGSDEALWVHGGELFRQYDLATGEVMTELHAGGATYAYNFGFAQPRQHATEDQFGWLNGDGQMSFFVDGLEVLSYGPAEPDIWMGEAGVAWAGYEDGRWHVHFTDLAGVDRSRSFDDTDARWPVALGSRVLFVRNQQVWAWDTQTDELELVLAQNCGPLSAHGGTAIVACAVDEEAPEFAGGGYLGLVAEQIYTIGPDLVPRSVYTSSDQEIFGPVLGDDWIVWLEYPSLTNASDEEVVGRVMVLRRDVDVDPFVAASVERGCWTCGAYWPPPRLDLDGNTAAFNYAIGPDDPPVAPPSETRFGLIGVLRLGAGCP